MAAMPRRASRRPAAARCRSRAATGKSYAVGFVRPKLAFDVATPVGASRIVAGLEGAWTHRTDDAIRFDARFVGAPAQAGSFPTVSLLDRDMGSVRGSIGVELPSGARLTVGLSGDYGARTRDESVSGKITIPF